jgi:hypothetical protein
MCVQCIADGGTYVAAAAGALQIMKVRATRRRLGSATERVDQASTETAGSSGVA